jgi:hypothetical protein
MIGLFAKKTAGLGVKILMIPNTIRQVVVYMLIFQKAATDQKSDL